MILGIAAYLIQTALLIVLIAAPVTIAMALWAVFKGGRR